MSLRKVLLFPLKTSSSSPSAEPAKRTRKKAKRKDVLVFTVLKTAPRYKLPISHMIPGAVVEAPAATGTHGE